jgi:hypothetical protein
MYGVCKGGCCTQAPGEIGGRVGGSSRSKASGVGRTNISAAAGFRMRAGGRAKASLQSRPAFAVSVSV